MDVQSIFNHLAAKYGEAVFGFTAENPKDGPRDAYLKVKAERWVDVALTLRDDPALLFDFLQNVTGVDWLKPNRIDVVYHLYSYPLKHSLVVKVELPRDKTQVPSVAGVWKSADWNEREQFDLMGIEFVGHPDLRRIMLPDDWVGHPLRKDYKEPEAYRGMSTTRPSTLELLPIYDKASSDDKKKPVESTDE
jgi:NADH-quinone oxidoreductase subunit C